MATTPLERSMPSARLRHLVHRDAAGALVLAGAIPILFLHERYQPTVVLDLGSTSADVRLSDAVLLAVVVAAVVAGSRSGWSRLSPARMLWLPGALLFAWLALEIVRPASLEDGRFGDHLVSFAKLGEYALLAVAVPLLVRSARDLAIVFGGLVVWAVAASSIGLLQFFGLDILGAWNAGWRQPSFLGHHDFAALAAIAIGLAAAGIAAQLRRMPARAFFIPALAAGMLGLILAGSVAAAGGLAVGAAALALAARDRYRPSLRRVVALAAVVAVVGGGVAAVRGDALEDFLRFIGVRGDEPPVGVETYSQRTVLAYIGLRIFQDNPVLGVGWQRSSRPDVFEPYVDDARARFPDVVDLAFPAPGREWGVQNLYIQMLADTGVIGLVLLLAVVAAGFILAWRTVTYAAHPWAVGAGLAVICALVTLAGEWASLGIVSGIPLQAATCLLLGLAAAGAAMVEEEAGV